MPVNRTPDLHKSTCTKEFDRIRPNYVRPRTLAGGLLKLRTKSLVEHTLILHYLSTNHNEPMGAGHQSRSSPRSRNARSHDIARRLTSARMHRKPRSVRL